MEPDPLSVLDSDKIFRKESLQKGGLRISGIYYIILKFWWKKLMFGVHLLIPQNGLLQRKKIFLFMGLVVLFMEVAFCNF